MMQRTVAALLLAGLLSISTLPMVSGAEGPKPDSPKKHTALDNYIKAIDAYAKWKAAPEKVHIIDVRMPEEYVFIGHAPMARNIPFKLWTGQWNAQEKKFVLKTNSDFEATVKKLYKTDDLILVMCRSGDRAAEAINALAKVGFTNLYNMVDSFEGDFVVDPESYFDGKRMKNGWKNSGAPWTYDLDPNLIYVQPETGTGK
jgi:rhodanese-related sulfurtransferase